MPLNGPATANAPADLLIWLTSETNTRTTGQIVFGDGDGGADATLRGTSIGHSPNSAASRSELKGHGAARPFVFDTDAAGHCPSGCGP